MKYVEVRLVEDVDAGILGEGCANQYLNGATCVRGLVSMMSAMVLRGLG